MIAIFNTKTDAQKYADKCHEALINDCPDYNAVKWQDAVEYKEGFGVKVPQEYYKEMYPAAKEIAKVTKVEFDVKKELIEKPELLTADIKK